MPEEDTTNDSKITHNTNLIMWIKQFLYSPVLQNFPKFLQRSKSLSKEVSLLHAITCMHKRLRSRGKEKVQYLKWPRFFKKSFFTKVT